MIGHTLQFFILQIVLVHPLQISSTPEIIQCRKSFLFCLRAMIHTWENIFQCLSVSVYKAPKVFAFGSFPTLLDVLKLLKHLLAIFFRALFSSDIGFKSSSVFNSSSSNCIGAPGHCILDQFSHVVFHKSLPLYVSTWILFAEAANLFQKKKYILIIHKNSQKCHKRFSRYVNEHMFDAMVNFIN